MQHCTQSPDSWVTSDEFKAGLALIQAMPGPMFNFSGMHQPGCSTGAMFALVGLSRCARHRHDSHAMIHLT